MRRVLPLGVIVVGIALLAGLFLAITQRMNDLRTAPADNLTWTLSQIEVDVLRLTDEALLARQTDTPDLAVIRRRFDNVYSRTDNVAQSRVFADMRGDETFAAQLAELQNRLDKLAVLIDSSDDALERDLLRVWELANEIREEAHDIALTGIALRSVASDEERAAFGRLLFTAAITSVALILFLGLMLFVLLRQYKSHRDMSRAAERANARLKASFDVSLDAIVVADSDGIILDYSGAAETVFGFTKAEAIGSSMSDLIVPHQHRAAHQAGMERFNKTGQPRLVGQGRIEITALRKSGEEFPIEISIGMAKDQRGTIFISYLRDITERLAAEENLKRARDEALQAEQAKSNFLAVMSHEMRTPLNGIFGTIELLQNTRLGKTQANYLGIAQQSADILQYHVNNVLDMSRMDVGKLELSRDVFELRRFFEDVVTTNATTAYARSNTLHLDLGNTPRCHVVADEQRLRQIAFNLVSNALKFTRNGDVTIKVDMQDIGADQAMLEFQVKDTGVGIAPEDQARVFERFFTQEKSYDRLASGAGLGLTICQQLVDMMSGEISLISTPGKGSTFTVRIPLCVTQDTGEPQEPIAAPVNTAALDSLDVLLVEDNEINRMIVRTMLELHGVRVSEACNGVEAVDKAKAGDYAAILMDISMPVMNGIDATKIIRQSGGSSGKVPILGLTAHALKDEQEKFLAAGMDQCLNKPVSQAELLRALVAAVTQTPHTATAAGSLSGKQLVDKEIFGELMGVLGADRLHKLLEKFETEVAGFLTDLPVLAAHSDLSELASRAHKSVGSAGMIGALSFQGKLRDVEHAAKTGDATATDKAGRAASMSWADTLDTLRAAADGTYPKE